MIKDWTFAKILASGPGTSIRDLGRVGYAQYGVPFSGPADLQAFQWNNHLLQNNENDAQLEISQPGFKIQFLAPTLISISGALAKVKLNNKLINNTGLQEINFEDILEIGNIESGSIIYIGIKHGFQSELILKSRSLLKGITKSFQIAKGDEVPYFTNQEIPKFNRLSQVKWNSQYLSEEVVRVFPGPEWDQLPPPIQESLLNQSFHISPMKNSMAVQLEELIPNEILGIASAPVFPGTIQLTSGGKLLCLLQDAQVTGGYPRILQVMEDDLRILAQKKPGQKLRFLLVKN